MIILIFVFIFGAIIGSFLNAVIWRLRVKKSFILGRSVCPKCGKVISWYDNVPIISYILLQGRCRNCRKKISWQYPLVEIAAGMLFLLAWINRLGISGEIIPLNLDLPTYLIVIRDWIFISILIIIFVYDLLYYLILDAITIPAMFAAVFLNVFADIIAFIGESRINLIGFIGLSDYFFGALVGGGFFYLQYLISRGKWIGGGDIRLGILMGLMLGIKSTIIALFFAYFLGSLVGIGLIIFGKKNMKSRLPFGTFLAVGTIVALFWGQILWQWYWRI